MAQPLLLQADQFLCAVFLGLAFGVLYDLLRGLRRNLRFLSHVLDLLFALCILLGNLLLALYVGNGQYRIFMLLGSTVGMALYFLTLSRVLLPVFTGFWRLISFPLRQFSRLCKKILEKIKKIAKNIFSTAKKSVKIRTHEINGQEGLHDAPAQIVTHYQAHHIGARGIRDRDDRNVAAKDSRPQGRKCRSR